MFSGTPAPAFYGDASMFKGIPGMKSSLDMNATIETNFRGQADYATVVYAMPVVDSAGKPDKMSISMLNSLMFRFPRMVVKGTRPPQVCMNAYALHEALCNTWTSPSDDPWYHQIQTEKQDNLPSFVGVRIGTEENPNLHRMTLAVAGDTLNLSDIWSTKATPVQFGDLLYIRIHQARGLQPYALTQSSSGVCFRGTPPSNDDTPPASGGAVPRKPLFRDVYIGKVTRENGARSGNEMATSDHARIHSPNDKRNASRRRIGVVIGTRSDPVFDVLKTVQSEKEGAKKRPAPEMSSSYGSGASGYAPVASKTYSDNDTNKVNAVVNQALFVPSLVQHEDLQFMREVDQDFSSGKYRPIEPDQPDRVKEAIRRVVAYQDRGYAILIGNDEEENSDEAAQQTAQQQQTSLLADNEPVQQPKQTPRQSSNKKKKTNNKS